MGCIPSWGCCNKEAHPGQVKTTQTSHLADPEAGSLKVGCREGRSVSEALGKNLFRVFRPLALLGILSTPVSASPSPWGFLPVRVSLSSLIDISHIMSPHNQLPL